MVILLDTSVLVSGMVASHPRHERSLALLQQVQGGTLQGILCAHSLAEFYAVLTAMPTSPAIGPATVERLLAENIFPYFKTVELTMRDYRKVLADLIQRQIRGGAIYDALILQAARKGKATRLATWNPDDFRRFGPEPVEIVEP